MQLPFNLKLEQLELVGEGQQGTVYRINEERCIKIYKKARYWKRELKALQRGQKSPYFPRIYQWGEHYIIREYIEGSPLSEYLIIHRLTLQITAQILELFHSLQDLGFKRLDIRLRHLILTPGHKLHFIDSTNMMEHHRTVPEKMLANLEQLGQKSRFLRYVEKLDPALYQRWK